MRIVRAEKKDIPELYRLQLLAFESEAEMIGSRAVPALQETAAENRADFANWTTLKLVDDAGRIVGAIRWRQRGAVVEVGRLMIHPDCRRRGLAQALLAEVDRLCPDAEKELYTCTKSWSNLRLYEKMGYRPVRTDAQPGGLSFVYLRKR